MKERICSVMMSLFLVCSSVLSPLNAMTVYATSGVAELPAVYDATMLLYSLIESVMISAGAKEGLDEYANGKTLLEAFDTYMQTQSAGSTGWFMDDFKMKYADGTVVYFEDGIQYTAFADGTRIYMNVDDVSWHTEYADGTVAVSSESEISKVLNYTLTDGTGALVIPDENTFAKYRLLDGGGSGDNNNDDSGDSEDPKDPFTKLESFSIGTGFIGQVGDFVSKLLEGSIEGVNSSEYVFADVGKISCKNFNFNPENFDINADLFTGNGDVLVRANNGVDYYKYTFRDMRFVSSKSYPLFVCVSPTNDGGIGISFYNWVSDNTYYSGRFCSGTLEKYAIDTGLLRNTVSCNTDTIFVNSPEQVLSISFDIPIVANPLDACAFFQNGDTSGILNCAVYDFPGLAEGVLEVLHPLTGINLSPNQLLDVNAALSTAAQSLPYPAVGTDPAENNAIYQQTLTAALPELLPVQDVETDPDSEPEPEPEPAPDPAEDFDAEDHKTDLKMIFPFCIPFDFINMLQALSAEPEAPCFEIPFVVPALDIDMSVKLDLSFLDPVMEIFRLGELGCFVILLMASTSKVIRW